MPEQGQSQAPGAGSATQLVTDINSKLTQLVQMISQSNSVDEDDKQMGAQLLQMFNQFVDQLGAAPGQGPKQGPGAGVSPGEAGAAKVQPAL